MLLDRDNITRQSYFIDECDSYTKVCRINVIDMRTYVYMTNVTKILSVVGQI